MEQTEERNPRLSEVLATKLEPQTKEALRRKARANHRSMAAEARVAILNHTEEEA